MYSITRTADVAWRCETPPERHPGQIGYLAEAVHDLRDQKRVGRQAVEANADPTLVRCCFDKTADTLEMTGDAALD